MVIKIIMAKLKIPSTQAMRFIKSQNIDFKAYFYKYVEHGGTSESAKQLNINEHRIVKTLILESDNLKSFIVLMNGDYEVSLKRLGRILGSKNVKLMEPKQAEHKTGYRVGGTSPFGCRTKMKIFLQKDITDLETIIINGGQRGFLIEIKTKDLINLLNPEIIDAKIETLPE